MEIEDLKCNHCFDNYIKDTYMIAKEDNKEKLVEIFSCSNVKCERYKNCGIKKEVWYNISVFDVKYDKY